MNCIYSQQLASSSKRQQVLSSLCAHLKAYHQAARVMCPFGNSMYQTAMCRQLMISTEYVYYKWQWLQAEFQQVSWNQLALTTEILQQVASGMCLTSNMGSFSYGFQVTNNAMGRLQLASWLRSAGSVFVGDKCYMCPSYVRHYLNSTGTMCYFNIRSCD